jgi:hypothetical protein
MLLLARLADAPPSVGSGMLLFALATAWIDGMLLRDTRPRINCALICEHTLLQYFRVIPSHSITCTLAISAGSWEYRATAWCFGSTR